jgi:hypothetical protein
MSLGGGAWGENVRISWIAAVRQGQRTLEWPIPGGRPPGIGSHRNPYSGGSLSSDYRRVEKVNCEINIFDDVSCGKHGNLGVRVYHI